MSSFPFYQQLDAMDCGPTCLRMIAKHYGKHFSLQSLRDKSYIARDGVSMLGLAEAAEAVGFQTIGVSLDWERLKKEAPLPLIAHWKQSHFVVVYKIKKGRVYVADPMFGLVSYSIEEFLKGWISSKENGMDKGTALLLQPNPDFYNNEDEKEDRKGMNFLLKYLIPYKKLATQLIIGLIIGGAIQLVLPFLFQGIVDFGINNSDPGFIYMILVFQFILILTYKGVDFIRRWILLHLSTRVNVALISDFLSKLMRLPISFFDTKHTGDLLQRIGDHKRIESFLTTSSLNLLFSLFNLVIFSIILTIFSWKILLVFLLGSTLYFFWVKAFMKKRRVLDQKSFTQEADNQSKMIQIIQGIEEIKINNAEKSKRWEWETIQANLFKVKLKELSLSQYQEAGGTFFNELKNILITIMAALAVLNGSMTIGMLLAVSYILGQLNVPLEQLIDFMHRAQDASISLERLNEVHHANDEAAAENTVQSILKESEIKVKELEFNYGGALPRTILKDISISLQPGSVTAIVGRSGSGKSTLLKLLLGFYKPVKGDIKVSEQSLQHMHPNFWRSKCGVVMQDGYIFGDTIAKNIALGEENVDPEKLLYASKTACIDDFIDQLPLGYNTVVGLQGVNLSGGEKQRILIARAVYKNPDFLFIDEGTSSLDAKNEKKIMENLETFFKGKTVVIVAHRLSTVKNADQILVLEKGELVESGNHKELTKAKGHYYDLIKNQLELGNS